MFVEGDTVWWGQANQHGSRHDSNHMLGLAADDRYFYSSTSAVEGGAELSGLPQATESGSARSLARVTSPASSVPTG